MKLVAALLVCANAAHASESLWGSESVLSGRKLVAGDTVTVQFGKTLAARSAKAGPEAGTEDLEELGARVVKILPNGNVVLELHSRFGAGSLLIGGEAARSDIGVDRRTHLSRLTNLAVVARNIPMEMLTGILRTAVGARVATSKRAGTDGKTER